MSLINDMLKDLDARRRLDEAKQKNHVVADLTYHQLPRAMKRKRVMPVLGIVLCSGLFFGVYPFIKQSPQQITDIALPTISIPTHDTVGKESMALQALKDITVTTKNNTTQLILTLDTKTPYYVDFSPQANTFYLSFPDVIDQRAQASSIGSDIMSALNIKQENQMLTLATMLAADTQLKALNFHGNQLYVTLQAAPINQSRVQMDVKKPHGTSQEIAWQTQYERALTLMAAGEDARAQQQLTRLVKLKPTHKEAREKLARLLIAAQDMQKAKAVLTKGLLQAPTYQPFIELQANVLTQTQQYAAALALLDRIYPELSESTDFYNLKAFLYRKRGQYKQAARMYRQLVQLSPTSSTEWLGLAMSLERTQQLPAAITAYRQAQATGQLDANVQRYVEQRLQQLQG